jgi:hypothetical protein
MRRTTIPKPILTVRIHFPSPSQPSTQPLTQPTAVDHRPARQLSEEEIRHQLKLVRHSSAAERYGRKATSFNSIAKATDISREYLYRVARGEPIGSRARRELSRLFSCE